jgi:hypothetical protein
VFGLDAARRAHASWFSAADAEAARRAAAAMGLAAVQVSRGGLEALAATLPGGKLFDSGRAFVPFVKGATYQRLLALTPKGTRPTGLRLVASGPEPKNAPPAKPGTSEGGELPDSWATIKVGSLVLATENRVEGWFDAIVTEANPSDMFTLKWRDFPDLEPFLRHRSNLALMFPAR